MGEKSNTITFTFHLNETDYCEDIKRIVFENFGIDNVYENERCDNNSRQLTISSKQLTYFLYENFGKLARGKKIPGWVFNLPTDSFIEMMRGYMGDARMTKNEVIYTSANKDLIEQLAYASKMHGLDCRISKRYNKPHRLPQGTVIQGAWCYDLKFSGHNRDFLLGEVIDRSKFLQLNQDLIPGKTFRKLADKVGLKAIGVKKSISKDRALQFANSSERLKALCNGDVHIVRVKSIEKLDRTMMVYDLHVPETQRFVGGNYPILLHNSELFGASPPPQNEQTPFRPRSPYAAAKIAAYWSTKNYREGGKLFAANSISYNHESARRGETFVTRKITRAATRIKLGLQDKLVLGNLDAKRDWNHAKDVAKALVMMANAPEADDWVVASGEMHSVKEFLEIVFEKLNLKWENYVEFDPKYLRPTEVDALCGDSTKIRTKLGWKPDYNFDQLVEEMVENDFKLAKNEFKLKS
jgi:GDPmannose 4,6-dehydratase